MDINELAKRLFQAFAENSEEHDYFFHEALWEDMDEDARETWVAVAEEADKAHRERVAAIIGG